MVVFDSNMLPEIVIFTVVISVVSCQINGKFWWLNSDIAKVQQRTAPPPTFDDVSELDTDETAKVIFREEVKKEKSLNNYEETLNVIHFRDETESAKPRFEFNEINMKNKIWLRPETPMNNSSQKNYDEFKFVFPSHDNSLWTDNNNNKRKQEESSNNAPKLSHNALQSHDENALLPEHICSFLTKSKCIYENGTIYEPEVKPNMLMNLPDTQTVCCILPISSSTVVKVIFPTDEWITKRRKRSNVAEVSSTLKQRNNLMDHKHKLDNARVRGTTPATRKKGNQMVVNSDEYFIDPYWNIKNANIRNPNVPSYQDPDSNYDYESHSYYGDDYAMELPKPGLVGLYSDHKQTQTTWIHNKNKGYSYDDPDSTEEEDFETSFGYSTIDPRKDHRLTSTSSKPFRRRPQKLTSISSTTDSDLPDPVIQFHSNPDFQLLQGFKLLNLVRHKNRLVRKTADINKDGGKNGLKEENKPSKFINYSDSDQKNDLIEANLHEKLFNECGKTPLKHDSCVNGQDRGQVKIGEHPWIAMVVLTKSERSILCYATLVHSRVAVTVADCVFGKSPGAVSVIAGVLNLDEDSAQSQRRMATIYFDTVHTPANLESKLALLHWLRPLTIGVKVHPACLGDTHVEDTCVFVGWSGYDQEMHPDLRWQRASILDPQNCNDLLSKLEGSDAFCAAVQSRETVTGVGGPLLCKRDGRWAAVGVAAWRNDAVIVLPLREWVMKHITYLRIL